MSVASNYWPVEEDNRLRAAIQERARQHNLGEHWEWKEVVANMNEGGGNRRVYTVRNCVARWERLNRNDATLRARYPNSQLRPHGVAARRLNERRRQVEAASAAQPVPPPPPGNPPYQPVMQQHPGGNLQPPYGVVSSNANQNGEFASPSNNGESPPRLLYMYQRENHNMAHFAPIDAAHAQVAPQGQPPRQVTSHQEQFVRPADIFGRGNGVGGGVELGKGRGNVSSIDLGDIIMRNGSRVLGTKDGEEIVEAADDSDDFLGPCVATYTEAEYQEFEEDLERENL